MLKALAQCEAKAAIVAPIDRTAGVPMQDHWAECVGIRDGDPNFANSFDSWVDLNSLPGARKP
jgi:hypothetical protein